MKTRVNNNVLCPYKLVRDFKCLCHKKKLRIQMNLYSTDLPMTLQNTADKCPTFVMEGKKSAAVLPERMTGTSIHRGAAQSLGWILRALLPPECHPTSLQNTTDSFQQPSTPLHWLRVVTITLIQLQLAGPKSFLVASKPIPLADFSPSHCKQSHRTH